MPSRCADQAKERKFVSRGLMMKYRWFACPAASTNPMDRLQVILDAEGAPIAWRAWYHARLGVSSNLPSQ